jgi:AraC-like DNA-binding protein
MAGMTSTISSSSAWLRGIVHLFASQGVETAWLFDAAGLDLADLKQPHKRFTHAEISRLWELAAVRSGQESLGLERQLARRFVNFDVAAQAMWPSPSLAAGLGNLARYLLLTNDAAAVTVHPDRGDCWVALAHGADGSSPRQRLAFGLLAVLMICQRVTHRQLRPLVAEFTFPEPADLHPYRMAFQCPIRFGQKANRIRLARDDLALPIVSTTESLFALHEKVIEARLTRLGKARTAYRASEEIIRRLHLGQPSRPDIARSLDLADSTLEQRLRAEGHSFEDLLDDVRRELAAHYLAQPGYAVARIAGLLGWRTGAELAAACRRWWGMPPAQYRQRLAADGITS